MFRKMTLGFGMVLISLLAGCGSHSNSGNVPDQTQDSTAETDDKKDAYRLEEANGVILCRCDILHNGSESVITIDYGDALKDGQAVIPIQVKTQEKVLWDSEIGLPHAGWGSYYITVFQGKTYMINYIPEESQGQIAYYYKIFHLNSEGEEVILDTCSLSAEAGEETSKKIEEFQENLNVYMEDSTLLISTMEGELVHYEKPAD